MSRILSSVLVLEVVAQLLHQHFGGCPGGPRVFGFPFFAIVASRLSSILFRSHALHARLLILAHLMIYLESRKCTNVSTANSIAQSVVSDAS